MSNLFTDDVLVQGNLRTTGNVYATGGYGNINRTDLVQENLTEFVLGPETWKIHDNLDLSLPDPPTGGSGNDDLGVNSGTFGTNTPTVQTGDNKTVTVTKYARRTFTLPYNYVAGETVTFRFHAGMVTAVADGSATLDVEVYKADNETLVDGSDLCTTAATSINSLTFADKDFSITATSLLPGDTLDIRIAIATVDTAGASAVIGCVGKTSILIDTKG